MFKRIASVGVAFALAGCASPVTSPVSAPVTTSTAARDLAPAQQVGPMAFQMLDPAGAALLAKGAAKSAVDTVCGAVGGVATALQDVTVTPAGITVQLPPSVTIPTKPPTATS